jgi:glutamate-ammonia-ligase adenylyltransferase
MVAAVELVRAIADGAPDPEDAGRRAERFVAAAAQLGIDLGDLDDDGRRVLALACRRAPYLATLLCRDPARLGRVVEDPYLRHEKPRAALDAQLDAALAEVDSAAALARVLRQIRADELVRLGARELELGLDTEVGRELARLADACLDRAIRFHDAELRRRHGPPRYTDDDGIERDCALVAIGMGKLGGEELNFASDVDLIFVYSSDAGAAGVLTLHEYYAKLCTAVVAALGEVTSEDTVFRVDLRLRPEGSRGAIANSLAQLEHYYEVFGRPWERQAWLKARPCAGDRALGAAVMATLRPFVYPRVTAPTVVDEVRDLNRRIKAELVMPRQSAGFDLKNGEGGIREIEFFVQALQLIHAGKRPGVRARGTLAALDQLLFAGLVSDDEHLALWRAYRWLRHVEHVLQLEGGLQTQRVPADPAAAAVLARRLGYADRAGFAAELARHTTAVARSFATLGEASVDPGEDGVAALVAGTLAPDAERAALARLGFEDPSAAQHELDRARRRPGSPLSPAATGIAARIGPQLLAEIAASADPDQALRHTVDLITRRGEAWSVWQLLADTPALLRLVISIFGASAYLAKSVTERPELIDLLVQLGSTPAMPAPAALAAELDRRLAVARGTDAHDEELAWSALAEWKNGEILKVGLADFAGALDPLAVCDQLTRVAEVCLSRAVDLVLPPLRARHGVARAPDGAPATLAVLGLGKLGGGELGYAADLDVVFVYSGDGETDGARPIATVELMSRWAQRLMSALHTVTPRGRLYELDTRLRPSGSKGLLVSSLDGWRQYHAGEARLWERQALIKLRPVAGDPALGRAVAELATAFVWGQPPEAHGGARAIAAELSAMRDRIERELGAPGDLKTGAGGVVDVEFAVQLIQLVHGHRIPALRTPSTAAALAAAHTAGLAAPRDLELLDHGYRFLRLVEHRLRVVHDQPVHRLPNAKVELDRLARRTGFPSGAELLDRLDRWRSEIRAAYTRTVDSIADRGER